ncbi:hypothetical protein [Flavilitoribacter nigricans]|uniref:Uncharacterized protein n=1 Tax=Flavilitoribacter nigricans (strain ATCC 23147 / DSM 23189 / NBRC 102662 / NCIMB 1420 / SS-2) TaxID=1122177 RepID=A0A2D0NEU2_FLAN2|nr:hypothetical protein [Flavilitoribacter nigricans]PHN06997.1 hypothetical protein CRP01_08535 [Flavilitoribacter nigricans DSM 23189 = NBRC 102662]
MAIEIECIIENEFDKSKIIELPFLIDNKWKDLRRFIEQESKDFYNPLKNKDLQKEAKWDFKIDEDDLENCWSFFETGNSDILQPKNDIRFICYFGMVHVYRKTIVINPFCRRFKAFKDNENAKKGFIKIVREIARLFGATKVLYCADSTTKTEILSNMALEGNSLQKLIEHGELRFGKPNPNYLLAFEETYFIDEYNFEIK